MINSEALYTVRNNTNSVVIYRIPDTNIRREFQPRETKKVPFSELEKLTYQRGGREILSHYLQVVAEEATKELNIPRPPEYNMTPAHIDEMLLHGSLDQLLDALDFAPAGVIDTIKERATALRIGDLNKVSAIREKTGYDISKVLNNIEAEKQALADAAKPAAAPGAPAPAAESAAPQVVVRRTNVAYKAEEASEPTEAPVTKNYKVIATK